MNDFKVNHSQTTRPITSRIILKLQILLMIVILMFQSLQHEYGILAVKSGIYSFTFNKASSLNTLIYCYISYSIKDYPHPQNHSQEIARRLVVVDE